MNAKFWKLIERDGKECRKPLGNPDNLIGKNFEGEAVLLIDKIYIIKNKGEFIPKSVISIAEEVLDRDIIKEESYFEEEYPVLEDSEDSEDDDSVDSRDGVDEHTPPPWKRTKDLRSKM